MKTDTQLDESIRRFQEVFWDKRSAGRPPAGVINPDVFLPIKYLRGTAHLRRATAGRLGRDWRHDRLRVRLCAAGRIV